MGPLNFMFHYHLIILHSIGNSMIEIFKEELRKKIINVKIASASGCRCFTDLGTNRVTKKTKYKQTIEVFQDEGYMHIGVIIFQVEKNGHPDDPLKTCEYSLLNSTRI